MIHLFTGVYMFVIIDTWTDMLKGNLDSDNQLKSASMQKRNQSMVKFGLRMYKGLCCQTKPDQKKVFEDLMLKANAIMYLKSRFCDDEKQYQSYKNEVSEIKKFRVIGRDGKYQEMTRRSIRYAGIVLNC